MDIEQRQFDQPAYATASVATGGANLCDVTITIRNANGRPVGPVMFDLYLSDATNGVGLTAVTASGTVQAKTAGTTGTDIVTYVAKKALRVQTLANGTYILTINDTAKSPFKVCAQIDDIAQVVTTLVTANYG